MGSEHVCACVYVGGVARLLLDPRPPMRERETPPPSWGGAPSPVGPGRDWVKDYYLVFFVIF